MHRGSVLIVTPALAQANNGNWQTASRWARLLRPAYRVHICDGWAASGAAAGDGEADVMFALHARRSAAAVAAWRLAHPRRPLVLVLTGTDLYRDIHHDAQARQSLVLADALVVLNELGAQALPAEFRGKCHVVLQSCAARRTLPRTGRHLRALMVGHLRDEKDPQTYFAAAGLLASRHDILLDHIGAALEPALGAAAAQLAAAQPSYRWLGGLPHAAVRGHIQRAHVLVHASRMEGGANVLIEALRSGTPVLASNIAGNLGLLGRAYGGIFEAGDAAGLARLLQQARDDAAMLPALQSQAAARAALFTPQAERAALHTLLARLLPAPPVAATHQETDHERPGKTR